MAKVNHFIFTIYSQLFHFFLYQPTDPQRMAIFLSFSGSVMIFIIFYQHHSQQLNLRKRLFSELNKFEDEIDQLHEEIYKLQKQSLLINSQIDEMSQKYFPRNFSVFLI